MTKKGIILGMFDDIRMWLYLRLLDSELSDYLPDPNGTGEGFGAKCCEVEPDKRFRYKDSFMARVQAEGMKIYLAFLPFRLHRYIFRKIPSVENVIVTKKTKTIFSSAEGFKYLDFPIEKTYSFSPRETTMDYVPDTKKIAVSSDPGNRFISWSGLVGFLYQHHWQFATLIWLALVYAFGKTTGLIKWGCENYPNLPLC